MQIARFAAAAALAIPLTLGALAAKAADIVDTAVGAGQFNTLVAAVKAAGLVDPLKSDGPFTVFAPNDEAFAKLPAGTVDNLLLPQNRSKLVSILTYHVYPGKIMAGDLAGKSVEIKSAQGSMVLVNAAGSSVMVADATVIAADVEASNGIIHVIDRVIMPPQ